MLKTYFHVLLGTLLVTDCLDASSKNNLSLNSTRIAVVESESVLLECICGSLEGKFWKYEQDFIFVGSNLQDETLSRSFNLTDYSLYITSVQLLHEGAYQCWCDYTVQKKYELNVEVIPNLFFTTASSNITVEVLYLEEHRNHSLMCRANGAKPPVNLKLMINGHAFNSSLTKFWVDESSERSGTYDSVAKLWIRPTDITGNISCIRSPQTISKEQHIEVSFVTYAIPRILLSIDGRSCVNRSTYVEEGHAVLVRCEAEGARPAANLTLLINNISFESTYSATRPHDHLFHTLINEHLVIIQETTLLTCIGRGEYGYAEQSVHTKIITFVPPKLKLTINGEHIPNGTSYNNTKGKWVLVTCEAFGARPSVNLTWLMNGTSFHYSNVTERAEKFNKSSRLPTSGTRAAINMSSAEGKLKITCACICYPYPRREFYYFQMLTTELKVDISITAITIAPSMFAVMVLSGLLYCSIYFKRRRKTRKKSVPSSVDTDADKPPNAAHTLIPMEQHNRHGNIKSMPLPTIPELADDSNQEDYAYFSECSEKSSQRRVFLHTDFTFVLKLSSGRIFYRSLVSSSSMGKQEYFVATTITEETIQKQTVRWNDFAKRVLDIPEIQFVINTHGIFFEKGMLSLVQEHVPCQTLQNFQETFKWNDSSFSLLKVTSFVMDIIKGMEFIHSYGFLHPGLSLRKVLLTEKGHCKLYDFSLSLDATNRVIFYKSKVTQSFNALPVESWQRNEYTQESDIWTLAVIIWELLSSGTSPFSCWQTEYANLDNMLITPTTSDQCLKIGNDILLKCWERNSSLRPSLSQLRSSFEQTMSFAEASSEEIDSTSTYIPMVGNVKSNSGTDIVKHL